MSGQRGRRRLLREVAVVSRDQHQARAVLGSGVEEALPERVRRGAVEAVEVDVDERPRSGRRTPA
jgi:hypothetical protein